MKFAVWILAIGVFVYTVGFARTLWKDKNKMGAVAIFCLAIAIVIAPFFSIF